MHVHWLVAETNPEHNPRGEGSTKKLDDTGVRRNWKMNLLNAGKPWEGFCQKYSALRDYIAANRLRGTDLVVVTDGRDVLVNRDSADFAKSFRSKFRGGVVFGTEQECCVEVMYEYKPGAFVGKTKAGISRRKPAISGPGWDDGTAPRDKDGLWMRRLHSKVPKHLRNKAAGAFPYLNGGLACGTVKAWKALLKAMGKFDTWEDDQALFTDVMLAKSGLVKLDYNQEFFSNSNVDQGKAGCFYMWDSGKKSYTNTLTKTMPYFIQTPGAKNDFKPFGCYMKLYRNLKKPIHPKR